MVRTNIRVSAIIIRNAKILLMHRKKQGEEYWVFPGGGMEEGETDKEAIVREVKEETNLDVTHCELAFMGYNEAVKRKEPFFECVVGDGEPEIIGEEKEKHSEENWYELEWVDINKLPEIWLVPEEPAKTVYDHYKDRG